MSAPRGQVAVHDPNEPLIVVMGQQVRKLVHL
jgi:hypothetical protein